MGRPRKPDSIYRARVEDLEEPDELLTLAEAKRKYGLGHFHLYAAAKRGELIRVRRKGGFTMYLESQLRRLAQESGLYSDRAA